MRIEDAVDLLCIDDLDPEGREATGKQVYLQDILHRLSSERGTLEGYPDDGTDIEAFFDADMSEEDISILRTVVESEARKDERTLSASAEVTFDRILEELNITLDLECDEGELQLIIGVSEAGLRLKGVTL